MNYIIEKELQEIGRSALHITYLSESIELKTPNLKMDNIKKYAQEIIELTARTIKKTDWEVE